RRKQRDGYVPPSTERNGRGCTEQHIPEHPAGITGDEGKNAHTKDVEAVLHADRRPADGEHARASKVQRQPYDAHRKLVRQVPSLSATSDRGIGSSCQAPPSPSRRLANSANSTVSP